MIPGVPYDEELEYIESTGTQWIDTGKTLSSTGFAYDADIMFKSTANCQVFSGRTQAMNSANDSLSLFVVSGAWRFDYFGNWKAGSAVKANTRYSVSLANGKTTVNGVELSTPITDGRHSGATVYIFAGHRPSATGGVEFPSSIRLYSLKFYQGGVLTADYQPVRIGTTGYLYDRVSKKLFGNQGTGDFILGPVVARPVMGLHFYPRVTARDYIQDGLIAMWDGIENAGWGTHNASATVWKDLVGINDLTIAQSSSLYFAETYLYASNTQYAEGDISKIPANLNNVTYEVCWNRVSKFDKAADSNNCYGQMVLDVYENKLWYKCSQQNGGYMNTPPSDARQGVPFTQSMICQYSGSADTIIPFVNGTQISNTILYSSNPQINRVRIGSGWQDPASRHHCIRIYNRALTAAEIAHNYNIDKWRFNLP